LTFASAASDAKYSGDMDRIIDGWIESVGQEGDVLTVEKDAAESTMTEASVD